MRKKVILLFSILGAAGGFCLFNLSAVSHYSIREKDMCYVGAQSQNIQYFYDSLGRVKSVVYPDGVCIIYEYDSNGNIISCKKVLKEDPSTEQKPSGGNQPGSSTESSAGKTTEKATESSAGKTTEKTTGSSAGKTTEKTTGSSAGKTTEKTTGSSAGKTTEKTTGSSAGKTTEKTTGSSAGKTTEKETGSSAGKTTEKETESSAGKTTEKTTESSANKTTEKITENPADNSTEKATENSSDKTTEKEGNTSQDESTEKEMGTSPDKTTEKTTENTTGDSNNNPITIPIKQEPQKFLSYTEEDIKNYNNFKKKKPVIKSLKSRKSKKKYYLKIRIKQIQKRGIYGETGYQIKYAANSKFKKAKSINLVRSEKSSITGKKWKIKKGKTYYVKVRAYMKTKAGKTIYSRCSKVKKIKVKK